MGYIVLMSDRELHDLIDSLDLNIRYNLRHTTDRRNRLYEFLTHTNNQESTNMATASGTGDPTGSTGSTGPSGVSGSGTSAQTSAGSSQQQMYVVAQTSREPIVKFAGNVPEGVPKREQIMAYDVNRWLCDVETRCQVKGITDDRLIIKEAKLAVSAEYGDATLLLNAGRMNEISDYSEFKRKCLKFWRPASERDRYHALSEFLSIQYNKSLGVFASNLEKARTSIIQDLQEDSSFVGGNAAHWAGTSRSSELLVSLNDILNYFTVGIIFKAAPPTMREALRKVDVKLEDDTMDILSSVQSEMYKLEKGVKLEVNFANRQAKGQEFKTNDKKKSYNSRSTRSRQETICYRCEKIGHFSRDCRVTLKCNHCKKTGHITSKCFEAKTRNKNKHTSKDTGDSNANVVDASDLPYSESDD